jgi:hypothetical protein
LEGKALRKKRRRKFVSKKVKRIWMMSSGIGQLIPAVVSFATAGFGYGLVLPVSSVILEEGGGSTTLIGLTATATFLE